MEEIKPYGVIYFILNKINGKYYVGKTKQKVRYRWSFHKRDAKNSRIGKNSTNYFYRSIRKYGEHNFELRTIFTCYDENTLNSAEIFFISLFDSKNSDVGYNSTLGGEGGPMDESIKRKISEANLGKPKSPEARANMSAAQKSKGSPTPEALKNITEANRKRAREQEVSEETRKRIGDAHRGKPRTEEEKEAMRVGWEKRKGVPTAAAGKPRPIEAVNKVRDKLKGRKQPPEIAAINRGRVHSQESKDNMKNGWAKRREKGLTSNSLKGTKKTPEQLLSYVKMWETRRKNKESLDKQNQSVVE